MEFKEKGKYDEEKWIWSEITNFFCINSSNIIFKKDTATHKYSQLKSETIRRAKFIINKKINYQSFSFFDFYLLEYHYHHHHQHQYQHTPISGILKVGGKYTVFLCFIITWYLVNNIEREKKALIPFFILLLCLLSTRYTQHTIYYETASSTSVSVENLFRGCSICSVPTVRRDDSVC